MNPFKDQGVESPQPASQPAGKNINSNDTQGPPKNQPQQPRHNHPHPKGPNPGNKNFKKTKLAG
ncbi:MAG: hypothetical protein ACJZ72_08030 [Opitutales bacterium]